MSEETVEVNESNDDIENTNDHTDQDGEKSEKLCRLPIARIKTLIKADQDVNIASQESVFLIAKATELFIEQLSRDVYRVTQGNKRKTIQKKDLDMVLEINDELAFLEGTLD
ncbi:DNA polymerase epsilon subunit 4-like [Styela clava]|uniref:DNA polymerase epsilon subunit 4-like n=1 Tax=Styela clava TaxID=7725 RepID=UPI00193A0E5A|nr:DNA polymerase epsilon subunit 4-like [Styela clava]